MTAWMDLEGTNAKIEIKQIMKKDKYQVMSEGLYVELKQKQTKENKPSLWILESRLMVA